MLKNGVVLAFILAIASINSQASTEEEMWMVVQKASLAAHALSYQGIFFYQNGQQSKPVQITHTNNGKGEFSRNVVLDITPRELFSQGSDLTIYNPVNEKVVIEKRRGQNMFPAILPTNLDVIKENYSLRPGEAERVAGRQTQMLFLDPKDNLRYSYRFWIDTEYGLLLKSVMYNVQNDVMESIAFNQLNLFNTVDLNWFQPKFDNKKSYVMEDEPSKMNDTRANTGWTLKELPSGYKKVDQMIRMVHGKSLPVTHVIFSDGLASVSLFIEDVNVSARFKETHKMLGSTSYYSRVTDGHQITALGEVPELTVSQIANAVVFNKQ